MKVLVVGSGGREHTLVWKINQSPKVKKIYCAPGNAGTAEIAENISISAENIEELCDFAQNNNIDLRNPFFVVGVELLVESQCSVLLVETSIFCQHGKRRHYPSRPPAACLATECS